MLKNFDGQLFGKEVEKLATGSLFGRDSDSTYMAARLVQDMAEASYRQYIGDDNAIACRAGCAHCCIVNVAVLYPEALSVVEHLTSSKSQTELNNFHEKLSGLDQETRWLDDEERVMVRKKCVFLNQQGSCGIYPFRPLLCRAVTSTSAADCKESLAMVAFDEENPVMANLLQREIFETAFSSLARALENAGMNNRSYRLTGSVRSLLEQQLQ